MFRFRTRLGGDCLAPVKEYPAAAAVFRAGDPVVLTAGLATTGAPADTTFIGIAQEAVPVARAAGTPLQIILGLDDVVFEADYVGTTKTTLTNADIGTAFDLDATDVGAINLDDTVDGAWVVIGFDNARKKAYVKLNPAKRALIA